jgi:hypothetical protein
VPSRWRGASDPSTASRTFEVESRGFHQGLTTEKDPGPGDEEGPMQHRSVRAAVGGLFLSTTVLVLGATGAVAGAAGAAPTWPQLQGDPQHTGFDGSETKLSAGNVDDLQVAWRAPVLRSGEFNDSAPVVVDGTVYAVGKEVAAFDATTGAERWRAGPGGSSFGTPAVGGGLVVVGLNGEAIVALDARTGAEVWRHKAGSYNATSITISGDRVFVTLSSGLLALRLQTGAVLWQKTYPSCFCTRSTPTRPASAPARRRPSPTASSWWGWAAVRSRRTTRRRARRAGPGPGAVAGPARRAGCRW